MTDQRGDELAENLPAVRARIADACVGRRPERGRRSPWSWSPSSSRPPTCGCSPSSASATWGRTATRRRWRRPSECADLDLAWHFIGGLQSNKAAAVTAYADVVHSVDRAKLVTGLSRGAVERGRDLEVLVQVSLDPPGAEGRSGLDPAQVPDLVERIGDAPGLVLRGVMGVAPLGGDPAAAFATLAAIAADVRSADPSATSISAGMSGDLEDAVAHGATHLRVGSAVLGPRPTVT